MGRSNFFPDLKRGQKWAVALSAAVVLYAGFGFLVAPSIIKNQAESLLLETFDRNARIGEVKVNPFALSLTVLDFTLPDDDARPLVSFQEFSANFEVSSIVRGALTFSQIRLVAPYLHAKIRANGEVNLADLAPASEGSPETANDAPPLPSDDEVDSSPPAILIQQAVIENGRILFSDLARPTPFEHEISPIDLNLKDFGTRPADDAPYSFTATTGAGEAIAWEGNLSVVPLVSTGQLKLKGIRPRTAWLYIQDAVRFEVTEGTLDLEGRYTLDGRDELRITLSEGAIRLRGLTVNERETREQVLWVPEFDVEGISLQYPEQTAHVQRVFSQGTRYDARRLTLGDFRGQRLALPRGPVDPEAQDLQNRLPAETSAPEPEASPWAFDIEVIELSEYHLAFEDQSTPTLFALDINPIDLRIEGLGSDFSRPFQMALSLGVGPSGRIETQGPIRLSPPEVDLDLSISKIDLTALAPYWEEPLALDLPSGQLGLTGRLQAQPESETDPQFIFEGDLRVDSLQARDPLLSDELFSFDSLELDGLSVTYEPASFHLARLGLNRPVARLVIDDTGSPNLATVLRETPEEQEPSEATTKREQVRTEARKEDTAPAVTVPASIQLIEITNGLAEFQDRSVSPYFSTSLSDFNGRIEGLTSAVDSKGQVELSGRLGGATALQINGSMNALSEKTALDLKVAFENFELSPFTPYSGRYVGKAIERGKLFVDLKYELDGNTLIGENTLFLDQFTLGGDIESPDAINLPIGLAVALLKDRQGEIHIDLPVRGEIDDPEFSVGGIVFSALLNLITKVAMSPFSIMGGLVSADADDLRYIEFETGESNLEPVQNEKLDALATALLERPVLSLEIKGSATSASDGMALKKARFESQLRNRSFQEQQSRWFGDKPDSVKDVVLEPADRTRLIRTTFQETFGKDALDQIDTMTGSTDPGSPPRSPETERERIMTQRLLAEIEIPPGELRGLARARAGRIQDHIIQTGGVPPERIFVLDVEVLEEATDSRPRTTLSLAAY